MVVSNARHNVGQVLDYTKSQIESRSLALLVDKAHSIVSQRYQGDINVVPPRQPFSVLKVLSNASPEDVARYIRIGETSTWPKIEMIRNSTMVSRTINDCLNQLKVEEERELLEFSKNQVAG